MPIHKQLRQRPLQRAPRDYWTPKLPSEPTCSDSEDTADPLNPLYSAVSASSSVSMEEEREAAPPGNVAVAFQPLYLLAEYALHETLQQEEETPLNHPGEDLNRENEPSEQVSGICGIMPHNYDPRTSILPESDSVFTNSEPRRPQEPESSSRSKPLPSHPLLETTEAPSRKPRKKPTAKRGRKPKIPTPDLDLTLPPELTSASSISYQPIAPRLKKPRQPRKTRKTPTKRKTKKIPKPAASTKRSAATRKVSADSVAPSGAQPDGQTAQNAQSAKQETRKDTAVSAGPDSRPETSEKSQATGINSSAAGDLKETKAKAVLAEDLPTKDRIDEDITIFADSNSGEEKDVDRDASPSASISSRDAAQPPAKSSDKLPVNDAAPAINAEPVKDGANDLQSAEESKDDSETAKELAPENDVTNNVAEDAQPTEESKDDDSKTAKDVAPADAVSELVAEDVAMNRSPARRVSSSEEQKEQASPKAPSSNGVVSEESEAEASKESREYGKGTKVKKFFEDRGCWLLGQIVENDKKDASSEFRIRFENDEDDEPEEMCIGESDTLSKMVRLANVVPAARLAIYWPDDEMYYPATVLQERRQNSKAFFVQYDDGMHEWINLWGNEFQLLSEDEDPAMMNRPRLRQRPATMGPRRRKSADDALGTTRRTKRKQTARSELFRDGGEPEADHSPQRRKRRTRNDGDANWVSSSGRTKRRRREVDRFGMGDNGDSKSDVERRKLGRPFQDRNSEDDGINDEESNSGFEEAAEAPKRKRGRPKGTSSEHTRMPLSGTVKKDLGATGRVKRSQSMVSKSLKVKGDVVGDGDSATETEISEGQSCKSTRGSDLVDSDEESSPRKRTKSSPRKRTKRVTQLEDVSVGVRVSVYWTDDEKFFTGTVTKHRSGKKPFYVEYDDGDNEWLDLEQQTFRIVQRGRFQLEPYSPSASRDASHDEPTPRRKTPRKKAETIDSPSAGKTTSPPRKRRGSHTTSPVKTNDVDMSKIVVGTRVAVWWPEDRRYYKGVVTRKQPEANWRPFFLEYDDGDEEWIDFRHHKFRILSKAEEESPASPVVRKDGRSADISQVWIGSRLSVWWPEEKEYFDCTVTRYRDHRRSFYLEYDDGDREWIDLADTDFFIVDSSSRRRRISK